MKSIFLTGGAGYIGSATAQALIDQGHHVTVYDSLVTGHRAAVPTAAKFIQADLGDREALKAALSSESFDAIMHFAAFIEAGESMQNPGKYFQNNVSNSLQLIESANEAGIGQFVLSSTAAVYASSDEPLNEESLLSPSNVYGHTKLMVERALECYREIGGLHYAALRYFNAAGAMDQHGEDHQPESHLIPLVLKVAIGQRETIKVFGTDYPTPDGTCIRDYIHISDLVSAHLLCLDALEGQARLVFNLGNGAGYSVLEVIEAARQVTGHPIPAIPYARRPGDSARLVASSDLIRHDLSWQPKIPRLVDIVASAWEWCRAHPHGYAP